MNQAEFDKFADEYESLHASNIQASGEKPEYFAEYKVFDTAKLAKKFGLDDNIRILDFGSGIGNSVPFFRSYLPQSHLTCVDLSEHCLEVAKQRFPGMAKYMVFDGKNLPFPNDSFEIIFTACVLHHIPANEYANLFREIYRVLAVGGIFIIFEHNPFNPLTVHAVNTCPFDENAVLIKSTELKDHLNKSGFRNTIVKYRIFFPKALRFLRFFEQFLSWLPLGAQYYAANRKSKPHE